MTIIVIAIGALVFTFLGGLFALRFKDKLHLVLGFSAGAVIAVAFFDLLPEALELGKDYYDASFILSISALGFLVYMLLDRLILFHNHSEGEDEKCDNTHHHHATHTQQKRGIVGATTLSVHSVLDGMAVGFAFKLSPAIGIIVAAAVLAHDFSDGINTVNLILKNGGTRKQAFRWLLVDACAPVVGVLLTAFFVVSESTLALVLAFFSGFFLYIGASDLLPESHHGHSMKWTSLVTVLGFAVIYAAIKIAAI